VDGVVADWRHLHTFPITFTPQSSSPNGSTGAKSAISDCILCQIKFSQLTDNTWMYSEKPGESLNMF